jgi:hypothetical protein
MSEALIRKIESERDALVRRYDAAISPLRGGKDAPVSEGSADLIREIEAVRDDVVRRYTASLEALRGATEPARHRFNPRVAPRPPQRAKRSSTSTPQPQPEPIGKRKKHAAADPDSAGAAAKMPPFRQMVREAVLAQTTAFSKRDIIVFVEHRYPAMKQLIPASEKGNRYANELLHMRKIEKLMDLDGNREKGARNNYLPRAA